MRRGSVQLRFDEPLEVINKSPEGTIKASRKKQLIVLGSAWGAAKIVDDSIEGAIGVSNARWVALPVGAAILMVETGGEVNLKSGYRFEVGTVRSAH